MSPDPSPSTRNMWALHSVLWVWELWRCWWCWSHILNFMTLWHHRIHQDFLFGHGFHHTQKSAHLFFPQQSFMLCAHFFVVSSILCLFLFVCCHSHSYRLPMNLWTNDKHQIVCIMCGQNEYARTHARKQYTICWQLNWVRIYCTVNSGHTPLMHRREWDNERKMVGIECDLALTLRYFSLTRSLSLVVSHTPSLSIANRKYKNKTN